MPYVNPKNPPLPAEPYIKQYKDGRLISPVRTEEITNDSWTPDNETAAD
jgi:hypothetical protein